MQPTVHRGTPVDRTNGIVLRESLSRQHVSDMGARDPAHASHDVRFAVMPGSCECLLSRRPNSS